jgi:hypothetical protein
MATVFRKKNQPLADVAVGILKHERPMTLRQLYYRCVSAGAHENSEREYNRLKKIMGRLREDGTVPRTWMVDHIRDTLKPSSWSSLADFADTVRDAYRKDFWSSLDHYVEVILEKDTLAGTIQPVTEEYDVALRVCRGYSSISFAGEIADQWAKIEKPIFAYYLGDYDPSGFDLERDLREKLQRYSGVHDTFDLLHRGGWRPPVPLDLTDLEDDDDLAELAKEEAEQEARVFASLYKPGYFFWQRLGVCEGDFESQQLIELPVKYTDRRAKAFLQKHGGRCAEVDAIAPTELRRRVKEAIVTQIDVTRWGKLLETERLEKESLAAVTVGW